jgi:ketosteroid isomerase-like protein
MSESTSNVSQAAGGGGSRWVYALGFFLLGAVVGDLVRGGDWRPQKNRKGEIPKVLAAQQDAWNRGDLGAFMASYWNSDNLTFCSGAEMTRGWQATFDRYKRRYQGEGKEMGTLSFSEIEVLTADDDGAAARGKFHLEFRDGKTSSGRFTLVLRRIDGVWKIIHDHTSADAPSSS